MSRLLHHLAVDDARQSELHVAALASLHAVRKALPPDGVALEYFQVDDRIVLARIDERNVEITPVSRMSRVAADIRFLQFQMSKFKLGTAYLKACREPLFQATQAHLRHLHEALLAPVWDAIRNRPVVVAPHGALQYVPFHALHDGRDYVVDRCPVSYAPSASVYARCHAPRQSADGPPLILGVADDQAPCLETEARAVAESLPGSRLYLGPGATTRVLTAEGAASRIIHIAAHGYVCPDDPMLSGIRLGDGKVSVYDLYRLELRADLVALSGCATGGHESGAGEELLGLARGLFCAGARSLLLSLWSVHDASTAAFMEHLYSQLARRIPLAKALRATMLAIRDRSPHPYYWAPFIATGRCWEI
jgi:CHAT domain-containing protein